MKNVLWLRSLDFQRASMLVGFWKSVKNRPKLALSQLFCFIFISVSFLAFAGWIDLGRYSKYYYSQICSYKTAKTIEFPLDCSSWNHTKVCPKTYPKSQPCPKQSLGSCPEYFRWIHHDLRHWRETGITEAMVEKARRTAHFRLTISGGKMYVEKFRQSILTRDLFTMWGFVQLMRLYPGKLPDLELMFDCDDRPVVPEAEIGREPPPLFRYCSDSRSLDIVFPDWSFWGWAEINIRPWRSMLKAIKEGNEKTRWEDRVPYAYWKGNPNVCPWRGELMQCNATDQNDWNARLYVQNWEAESREGFQHSNIEDQCTHRYKIYIEGWGWSVSEKYIFACDSPTLLMTLRWHDFFIRGMTPQKHYWPVKDNDKCRSLKFAVEWGNNHTAKAKAIGEGGSRFIHEDMKMEYVYDYIFHLLNEYAKLLRYKPKIPPNAVEVCSESLACSADGNWRKFMEESMEKSASDSAPCTMPPPYEDQQFKALVDEQAKATKQVEAWEEQYWSKQR
ncbi:O-glucosyltransferase rumi [Salvia divinorum]|uniref:O-glucosyltransferase rumi n=1 Tax=Salvia divinorum TaxID=28513 RepID=A0ABD1G8U7_SALDI